MRADGRVAWWRGAVWGVALSGLCTALPAGAASTRAPAAHHRSAGSWERAERARAEFAAIPEAQRTQADYGRVLDGYRAVYHQAPGDPHAAEAVYQVAGLLASEGRGLGDTGLLGAAVKQYEFLRGHYPGSSWQKPALLDEGRIEARDLHDPGAARERWQLLLQEYPGSSSAAEARTELAALETGRGLDPRRAPSSPSPSPSFADSNPAQPSAARSSGESAPATVAATPETAGSFASQPDQGTGEPESLAARQEIAAVTPQRRPGHLAAVTGIRHWSTPTYTRVAIDLGDQVDYQAARVTGPDRIYFDLHGTRLAPELVGKSFAVTDDGFLKRIRAAQFRNDMTRVVLDVNDVTEYSAFLLPNPYRLIIDIHGGKPGAKERSAEVRAETAVAAANEGVGVPPPATATVIRATPARPVPNTVVLPAMGTTAEVARVSQQPGRVEATAAPGSQPIAAVVERRPAGREPVAGQREENATGREPAEASAAGGRPSSGEPPAPEPTVAAGKRSRRAGRGRGAALASGGSLASDPASPARAAVPTADGQTSLVRALGLKIGRIVIDAGHGGHDSGTIGVDGLEEKDVVLDVALRLGKLLHQRLGAEVIYTRSDDTFVPLETRTAIANKAQADLFLSIHANSSPEASARGVETYYLNFTSDPRALTVAARENAVSDQSVHQLSDLVKKIALKDKIAESREFASDVESSLYAGLARGNDGLRDRGVKKAPFVVLIGANMPSILAEISFVTNPRDASLLRRPEYRERVAESLYRGVARYQQGLSAEQPVASERAGVGATPRETVARASH